MLTVWNRQVSVCTCVCVFPMKVPNRPHTFLRPFTFNLLFSNYFYINHQPTLLSTTNTINPLPPHPFLPRPLYSVDNIE